MCRRDEQYEEYGRILLQSILADATIASLPRGHNEDGHTAFF